MAELYPNSSSPAKHTHWGIVLAWAAPVAFLLWLWFDGLKTWFVADDFAWLSLLRNVHSFPDLLHALFAPAAQGTIRPWSERGFFLLFESLFGIDSLPYRICVFLTIAADLALIVWITRRITGSLLAGSAAAILWTANGALATVAAWIPLTTKSSVRSSCSPQPRFSSATPRPDAARTGGGKPWFSPWASAPWR